jgi:hypothetical protein
MIERLFDGISVITSLVVVPMAKTKERVDGKTFSFYFKDPDVTL